MAYFRRDDGEASKLDLLIDSQQELQAALEPLQANLERALAENSNLTQTVMQEDYKAQLDRLFTALAERHREFLDEASAQKSEVLGALQQLREVNQAQITALRGEFGAQLQTLGAQNAALHAQIQQHRAQWQQAHSFEISDETPAALDEWCDDLRAEFAPFGACTGAVRLLAARLMQHFQALCALRAQIEGGQGGFESRLDELGRTLFAPEIGASWNSLTPLNSTPAQRRTLRNMETAIWEFRAAIRETLRRVTGIAPLEIVPLETRFDARFHESSEFLDVPTGDPARHNLILAVERPGYQQTAPDGTATLLQVARVRRSVLSESARSAASPAADRAPAPLEESQSAPLPPPASPSEREAASVALPATAGQMASSGEAPLPIETLPASREGEAAAFSSLDSLMTPREIPPPPTASEATNPESDATAVAENSLADAEAEAQRSELRSYESLVSGQL